MRRTHEDTSRPAVSSAMIDDLRAEIAAIAARDVPEAVRRAGAMCKKTAFSLGAPGVDNHFPLKGLKRNALHEIFAMDGLPAHTTAPALSGFALSLAIRAMANGGALLWVSARMASREAGGLYAPGLQAFGLDPARLFHVETADAPETLWVMEEGLKSAGLAMVTGEIWGAHQRLDMTASRRLHLAANRFGVTALMLRHANTPTPGAAETRWRIAPAAAIAVTPRYAMPPPAWRAVLERNRAGSSGALNPEWVLEWHPHTRHFHERHCHDGHARHTPGTPPSRYLAAHDVDRPGAPPGPPGQGPDRGDAHPRRAAR